MKSLTKNVLIIGGKGKNGRRVAEKLKSHKFNPIVTTRTINAHVENERYFDWNDRISHNEKCNLYCNSTFLCLFLHS